MTKEQRVIETFITEVQRCVDAEWQSQARTKCEELIRRATIEQILVMLDAKGQMRSAEREAMELQAMSAACIAAELTVLTAPDKDDRFVLVETDDWRAGTPYRLRLPSKKSNSVSQDGWLVPTYLVST